MTSLLGEATMVNYADVKEMATGSKIGRRSTPMGILKRVRFSFLHILEC